MGDFFISELKYFRIPVNQKARKQAELEELTLNADQLRKAGARVILNEDTLSLHHEFNANPNTSLGIPKVKEAETIPTETFIKMRTVTKQQTKKYEEQTPVERLKKQSEQLTLRGITHTVDLEELTLRVGHNLYKFGAKECGEH